MSLTAKQELFCRAIVEGKKTHAAYLAAGYEGNRKCAEALIARDRIKERIALLQERQMDRHDINVDSLLLELEDARKCARKSEQSATMVQAVLAKARLLGLITNKMELSGHVGVPKGDLAKLSDDELLVLQQLAQKMVQQATPESVLQARRN